MYALFRSHDHRSAKWGRLIFAAQDAFVCFEILFNATVPAKSLSLVPELSPLKSTQIGVPLFDQYLSDSLTYSRSTVVIKHHFQRFHKLQVMTNYQNIKEQILAGLNTAQLQAVTAPPDEILQVIAGPGTGKTKVLTSRVAYLLTHHDIPPECILVTTFTKKAANEMKQRLLQMLDGHDGKSKVIDRLLIGTFHSLCVKILKRHGRLIGWSDGFQIAAERDVNDILESIKIDGKTLKEIKKLEDLESISPKPSFRARISSLKSKGISVSQYLSQADGRDIDTALAEAYKLYNEKLEALNLMDFDDLLLNAERLLSGNKVLTRLKHVLVDEFQDTNQLQLKLLHAISSQNNSSPHNVTIVGDPDQSIYGFRDAESKNFKIMRDETYRGHPVFVMNLSENYRSTQSVLDISETLMTQQKDRISDKSLVSAEYAAHHNILPVLAEMYSISQESKFIAHEISTIVNQLPRSPYSYSDIAILLRSSFMSRLIERELSRFKIPYDIVKGRGFWERKEVTAIMDWLRIASNPNDRIAIVRAFKLCSEGVGPATVSKIGQLMETHFERNGEGPVSVLKRLKQGRYAIPRANKDKLNKSISLFLRLIDSCLDILNDGKGSDGDPLHSALAVFDQIVGSELFQENVINVTDVPEQQEERKENVKEVRSFLAEFKNEAQEDISLTDEHPQQIPEANTERQFLANFIISVDLYLTQSTNEEGKDVPKVSISTIHAAKGLEWAITFVPGLREGAFPSKKSSETQDQLNEERRVLYIALTRAKHLCYLVTSNVHDFTSDGVSRFLNSSVRRLATSVKPEQGNHGHIFADLHALKTLYGGVLQNRVGVPEDQELISILEKYPETYQRDVLYGENDPNDETDEMYGTALYAPEMIYKAEEVYQNIKEEAKPSYTTANRIRFAPGSANSIRKTNDPDIKTTRSGNSIETKKKEPQTSSRSIISLMQMNQRSKASLSSIDSKPTEIINLDSSDSETESSMDVKPKVDIQPALKKQKKTLGIRRGPIGPLKFEKK
ncbi:hypothetical protein WICPIJ_010155 [Wickerhamomyces pijperi]|uniref:DNA 3'-5' helicase n=1 Tax=Wickerhamomyces pijperi TaxID=599730 RepID=A0A9P8TBF9_WICPI|nr:hypothetical protein WICPIJ_010155 [Wickerhamomyces pijperi]